MHVAYEDDSYEYTCGHWGPISPPPPPHLYQFIFYVFFVMYWAQVVLLLCMAGSGLLLRTMSLTLYSHSSYPLPRYEPLFLFFTHSSHPNCTASVFTPDSFSPSPSGETLGRSRGRELLRDPRVAAHLDHLLTQRVRLQEQLQRSQEAGVQADIARHGQLLARSAALADAIEACTARKQVGQGAGIFFYGWLYSSPFIYAQSAAKQTLQELAEMVQDPDPEMQEMARQDMR